MSIGSTSAHETHNLSKFSPGGGIERRKVVRLSCDPDVIYTVIKWDGSLVPFDLSRVRASVESAFRGDYTVKPPAPPSGDDKKTAEEIVFAVAQRYSELASGGACPSLEEIQEILEERFRQSELHEAAEHFAAQRQERGRKNAFGLRVLRSDGKGSAKFNPARLTAAVIRAFKESGDFSMPASLKTVTTINSVTRAVAEKARSLAWPDDLIDSAQLADLIEETVMAEGLYRVAKHFILSRSRGEDIFDSPPPKGRAASRITRRQVVLKTSGTGRTWVALDRFGRSVRVTERELRNRLERFSTGLPELDRQSLFAAHMSSLRDGQTLEQIDLRLIDMAKKQLFEAPGQQQLMAKLWLELNSGCRNIPDPSLLPEASPTRLTAARLSRPFPAAANFEEALPPGFDRSPQRG